MAEEFRKENTLGLTSVWWPLIFIHREQIPRVSVKKVYIASSKPEDYNNISRDLEDYIVQSNILIFTNKNEEVDIDGVTWGRPCGEFL